MEPTAFQVTKKRPLVHTLMSALTLDKLELELIRHVNANDRAGVREVVIKLCDILDIPPKGDPTLVVRDLSAYELLDRCAELLFVVRQPAPPGLCAHIMICALAERVTTDDTVKVLRLARRALELAEASKHMQTVRRALNIYSSANILFGDPTVGFDYAARSYALSVRLNDESGASGALQNAGAALVGLDLHHECIKLNFDQLPGDSACGLLRHIAAGRLINTATSYFALRNFSQAAAAASQALRHLDDAMMSSKSGLWYSVSAECVLLRCAIQLGDSATASAQMRRLEASTQGRRTGRVDIICEQASAAYDCYLERHSDAIGRLIALCERTNSLPTLHTDTLSLLQTAYQAAGDHASALSCLAEDVEHRSRNQVVRVARVLRDLGTEMQTVSSTHEVAAEVIGRIRTQPKPFGAKDERRTNASAMQDTFERLAVAAELNEDDSGRHTYRVGRLTGLLAAEMGHDAETCDNIERAARLHDIGKLGLPGALLARPQTLSVAETKVMREHTEIGRKILEQANDPAFDLAKDVAYSHRERWDGTGYPQQLRHAAIPEAARMVAVAEAFDVLTHGREYQAAVSVPDALTRIQLASGTQFEPRLVTAFFNVVNRLYSESNHNDALLSDFLGSAGTASSFLQARESMHSLMSSL